MLTPTNTKATVITGPHGSSGSPVPPRTPSRGDPASPKEAPLPAPMEPGTPLPPSRRDSASPTEASLPPYHGSPSPAPEEQQGSSHPTTLPSPGNEDDPQLPKPILLPSSDSELHAVLRAGFTSVPEFSASDRQALENSSSISSSLPSRVIEDERVQSVLNKLYEYASFHRLPLEALFGTEYQKSTPKAPPKDPKVIRANPPPAVPRPSSLDGDLRQFHMDETPRSPVLDTDLLVRSHVAVPVSLEEPTSSSSRTHVLPKVRPLGTYSNPVPDREDYLPFMKEFAIWSREANGTTPFTSSFRHGLGAPKLDLDLPRAYLKGVNPRGILQFIQSGLIEVWKSTGLLDPLRWSEQDVWYLVILHSQYENSSAAEQHLETTLMDWKKSDTSYRWYDYINRFQNVLARSTLAGVSRGIPASSVRINREFVKQTFLANVGILRIYVDRYPQIHSNDPESIREFIALVGNDHLRWSESKSFTQQSPFDWSNQSFLPTLREAREAQLALAKPQPTPNPQARPRKGQASPRNPPSTPTPSSSTEKEEPSRQYCRFCHEFGHVKRYCRDPDCRDSIYFDNKAESSRRGPRKDSKRGAPSNKRKGKYLFFINTSTGIDTNTGNPSDDDPSEELAPDVTRRYVASCPVPLREGSRRAGKKIGNRSEALSKWGEFDAGLASVFGYIPPDASDHDTTSTRRPRHVMDSPMTGHRHVIDDTSPPRRLRHVLDHPSTSHRHVIDDTSPTSHPRHVTNDTSILHRRDPSGRCCSASNGYSEVEPDLYSIDYIDHTVFSIDQDAQPIKPRKMLHLHLLINDVPVTGVIDTAASCSVITKDLASSCHMQTYPDSIRYVSANNVTSSSLGSAQGVLSFQLGSIANQVRLNHRLPIIPGSETLLIGIDILSELGLLNEDSFSIKLDKEHSVILLSEAEFDNRITMADESSSATVTQFSSILTDSGCTILLDDEPKTDSLVKLLRDFQEVFSSLPHADGIDCPPMEINFHNPSAIVNIPARRLNPEKLKIAEGIFKDLVTAGFAYFTEDSKFSSPVVLVTYPDHRKPRLTGDFSGSNGVNANTIPVDPNLPRISDVLEFLSSANYIATLDLPKAFWQLNVALKDQEKTTLSIPGMSIAFRRACFGLKNVPAIFQNIMSQIFNIPGVFIYIDDVIIVGETFDEFLDKIRAVLLKARSRRVNIGLQKCTFTTSNHPVKILGHVFHKKTRSIDSSRIKAVIELPPPGISRKSAASSDQSITFVIGSHEYQRNCPQSSTSQRIRLVDSSSSNQMDT
ncbi:hypothetical protein RCL1_009016 [Eukaryota sp. TZLM3-RCL]